MTNHVDAATPLWLTELAWGSAPPDSFGINKGLAGQAADALRLLQADPEPPQRLERAAPLLVPLARSAPGSTTGPCSFCGSAGLLRYNRTPKPAYSTFRGFTAETTPPQASITAGPGQGSFTKRPDPDASRFASNEAGSTFECRVDAERLQALQLAATRAPPLSDGTHTFFVKAIDAPGNESQVVSRSLHRRHPAPRR